MQDTFKTLYSGPLDEEYLVSTYREIYAEFGQPVVSRWLLPLLG
jgi:hypothetical protein